MTSSQHLFIESDANPRLKRWRRLALEAKAVRREGATVLEGIHLLQTVLEHPEVKINAVMLPNRADHYAKEVLRIRGYGRYMDDTYLLHHSIAYLEECLEKLRTIYSEYGIVINEKKTKIVDLKHGFTFLKTHFYITETGRIIKKPCRDSITRERRKLKRQAALVASGVLTFDEVRRSYASWRGSMSHRDAYRTVQSMDRLFNGLFIDQWKGGPQP